MDLIKITDEFVTINNEFYDNVSLLQGHTYLMREAHVQHLVNLGLGQRVEGFDRLPHLPLEAMRQHSQPVQVLFLFEGGLGDAIALAVLLDALKSVYNINSGVACKYEVWTDIMKPLGFLGNWVQLPAELKVINNYDYIQTSGDRFIKNKTGMHDKCIVEELGQSYGVDLSTYSIQYSIPEEIRNRANLPDTQQMRMGVNFDSKGLIKSYPKELQPILINYFVGVGFNVFLFGLDRPNLSGIDKNSPVHDYCGKTTVPELAAKISQMDIMVCVDSFIAHLSNIVGINTIVMLSTTRKGIFRWHKKIRCLESQIECAPCGEIAHDCPVTNPECQAFFHESIRPEVITHCVINECARYFRSLISPGADRMN
jgi:hypothetical protein